MTSFSLALRLAVASGLLGINLLLGGCASTGGPVSLTEVREFADASAKLGGYSELSRRYRDTYEREQPYLPAGADKLARENDAKRRAVYDDFVSVQKALVLYMQTLSLLAGDARYDLSASIDDLGNGLKANTESGLQQRHVTAYTGLTRLLTRVIASGYQNRSVETMVRDGDADVQVLLDAMISLTRLYYKTNENEKKTILGIFDVELPFAKGRDERMLVTLAKVHYIEQGERVQAHRPALRPGPAGPDQGRARAPEAARKPAQAVAGGCETDAGQLWQDLRMIREGLAGD